MGYNKFDTRRKHIENEIDFAHGIHIINGLPKKPAFSSNTNARSESWRERVRWLEQPDRPGKIRAKKQCQRMTQTYLGVST